MNAAEAEIVRAKHQGDEQVAASFERDSDFRRKYADDGERLAIYGDRSAEHIRIAGESSLPHPAADDGDAVGAGLLLAGRERASKPRAHAERLEKTRCHALARNTFRIAGPVESVESVLAGNDESPTCEEPC